MTIVRYTGPADAIDIPTDTGTVRIERNATADIDNIIAIALVAQGDFALAVDDADDDIKRELVQQARDLGIEDASARWSVKRLQAAIDAAPPSTSDTPTDGDHIANPAPASAEGD